MAYLSTLVLIASYTFPTFYSFCRPGSALPILPSYWPSYDVLLCMYYHQYQSCSTLDSIPYTASLLSTPPLCIYRGLRAIQNRQSFHTWLSGSTPFSLLSLKRLLQAIRTLPRSCLQELHLQRWDTPQVPWIYRRQWQSRCATSRAALAACRRAARCNVWV